MEYTKRIDVIALDLDGTLLNTKKEISAGNKEAIQRAREAGIKVVLCTGRPLKGITHILEELDLLQDDDISINYNGEVIQRTKTKELLYQETLSKEECLFVYNSGMQVGLPSVLLDLEYVYEPEYPIGTPSYYSQIMKLLEFKPINIKELPDHFEANKILYCVDDATKLDTRISQLPQSFFDAFYVVKSRPNLLEIVHKNVNKGAALRHLAEILNITTDNIMACGDEENDIEMLTEVGIGVAMKNASEQVKQVANMVTDSNDNDGVAKAIYHAIDINQKIIDKE